LVAFVSLSCFAIQASNILVGASLPMTALVDQFYAEVQAIGGKRWDMSSLLARLERNS